MFLVQLIEAFVAPIVMTKKFIRQEIDIGVLDIMYQISNELADIAKPMVQNEFQQAKDLEVVRANSSNNSVNNIS